MERAMRRPGQRKSGDVGSREEDIITLMEKSMFEDPANFH
jgi:hypothetical protein